VPVGAIGGDSTLAINAHRCPLGRSSSIALEAEPVGGHLLDVSHRLDGSVDRLVRRERQELLLDRLVVRQRGPLAEELDGIDADLSAAA